MTPWSEIRHQCPRLYKNPIEFECGLGWIILIRNLSLKIEDILQKRLDDQEIYAVQVKEKFGSLRFYMSALIEDIYSLIQEAEALSAQTCESCGAPGKMRDTSWYQVRCDECFKRIK